MLIWGLIIEPNLLTVKSLHMKMPCLPKMKIVFVSDFHIKTYQKTNLKRIVNEIKTQNPDMILSTGDFVSGYKPKHSMPIEEIAKELSTLKPKYGFYAVLGNHDWWQGGERIEKVLEKNGIHVLGNENEIITIGKKKLYLAGVEDITTRTVDFTKALKNTKHPTILLTHSPDVFPFVSDNNNHKMTDIVDLTLAGHTHGGQIDIPFIGPLIIPSDYGKKYAEGLIKENSKTMYVTKGIGTSVLPVRFNCVPEIVVVNFN